MDQASLLSGTQHTGWSLKFMHSQASAEVMRVRPSVMAESSLDYGWTSTLLERRQLAPGSRALEAAPTGDAHIVVALTGNLRLEVFRDGRWSDNLCTRGAMFLTPGDEGQRLRSSNSSSVELVHLFVGSDEITSAADAFRRPGQSQHGQHLRGCVEEDSLVHEVVKDMLWAMRLGASETYAEQALALLSMHLLARHTAGYACDTAPSRHNLTGARLAQTIELVHERFSGDLSLSELAAEARISKFYFSRLFREKTGMSPHAYVESVRMANASRLLASSDLPISDVASQCGYARPVQFGVAFKRKFGIAPTQFRMSTRSR